MVVVYSRNGYGLDVDFSISVLSLHAGHDGHVLVARLWATVDWNGPLP